MTPTEKESFFTAGELANLFGISKQTLLYYHKIGLLSPEFIAENNYRHYTMQQYQDLEIIVNLRSFDVSIQDIKTYLERRSKHDFIDIAIRKKAECENIIKEKERIIKSLDLISKTTAPNDDIIFYQPFLTLEKERLLKVTNITDSISGKERVMLFTSHAQKSFHNKQSLEKQVGWIITQEDFFDANNIQNTKGYFSFVSNTPKHRAVLKNTLPTGMYLEVYFKGTFYDNAARLNTLLQDFMKLNNLTPVDDVYILPIENHLFYDDTEKYINKIFVRTIKK